MLIKMLGQQQRGHVEVAGDGLAASAVVLAECLQQSVVGAVDRSQQRVLDGCPELLEQLVLVGEVGLYAT